MVTDNYYPGLENHIKFNNMQDGLESCPSPYINIEQNNKHAWIYVHKSDGISADAWFFWVPDLYEQVEKYNEKGRIDALRNVCGIDENINKFDKIKDLISSGYMSSNNKVEQMGIISKWRSAYILLARKNPNW